MARRLRLLPAIALAALLQGCFTSASLSSEVQAPEGIATGLVFGSIGVSSTAPSIDLSSLQFRQVGFGASRSSEFLFHSPVGVAGALLSPMFRTPVDFDEPTGKGTLFVARLPAGNYEIVSAAIADAPYGGWGAHVFQTDAGSVPFHVEPGKATYLGQFLSHLAMGRDRHGIPAVTGAYFTVSDRLERDLALLSAREAAIAPAAVLDLSARFVQIDNPALRPATR
jgi:hypothetical protein